MGKRYFLALSEYIKALEEGASFSGLYSEVTSKVDVKYNALEKPYNENKQKYENAKEAYSKAKDDAMLKIRNMEAKERTEIQNRSIKMIDENTALLKEKKDLKAPDNVIQPIQKTIDSHLTERTKEDAAVKIAEKNLIEAEKIFKPIALEFEPAREIKMKLDSAKADIPKDESVPEILFKAQKEYMERLDSLGKSVQQFNMVVDDVSGKYGKKHKYFSSEDQTRKKEALDKILKKSIVLGDNLKEGNCYLFETEKIEGQTKTDGSSTSATVKENNTVDEIIKLINSGEIKDGKNQKITEMDMNNNPVSIDVSNTYVTLKNSVETLVDSRDHAVGAKVKFELICSIIVAGNKLDQEEEKTKETLVKLSGQITKAELKGILFDDKREKKYANFKITEKEFSSLKPEELIALKNSFIEHLESKIAYLGSACDKVRQLKVDFIEAVDKIPAEKVAELELKTVSLKVEQDNMVQKSIKAVPEGLKTETPLSSIVDGISKFSENACKADPADHATLNTQDSIKIGVLGKRIESISGEYANKVSISNSNNN